MLCITHHVLYAMYFVLCSTNVMYYVLRIMYYILCICIMSCIMYYASCVMYYGSLSGRPGCRIFEVAATSLSIYVYIMYI